MKRRGLTARLAEINRIGAETGRGEATLMAAVLALAMDDARHGVPGALSDPLAARAWVRTTGRQWVALLQPPEEAGRVHPAADRMGVRVA